jgi:hypothetical protein
MAHKLAAGWPRPTFQPLNRFEIMWVKVLFTQKALPEIPNRVPDTKENPLTP